MTVTVSGVSPLDVAVTTALHARVAVPPYAGRNVVLTSPAGMVTDAGAVTHSVSAEDNVTTRSDSAATGVPLLSSRTVRSGPGRPLLNDAPASMMFSPPLLLTVVVDGE